MSSVILRYTIPFQKGKHTILMPKRSQIIEVAIKEKEIKFVSIWAIVDSQKELVEKTFHCIETNEKINHINLKHWASITPKSRSYALHIFEEL